MHVPVHLVRVLPARGHHARRRTGCYDEGQGDHLQQGHPHCARSRKLRQPPGDVCRCFCHRVRHLDHDAGDLAAVRLGGRPPPRRGRQREGDRGCEQGPRGEGNGRRHGVVPGHHDVIVHHLLRRHLLRVEVEPRDEGGKQGPPLRHLVCAVLHVLHTTHHLLPDRCPEEVARPYLQPGGLDGARDVRTTSQWVPQAQGGRRWLGPQVVASLDHDP